MANIEIENAELIMPFRNFSGKPSKFNKEGNRNFAVYLPDDICETLKADGWNIKMTNPNSSEYESRPYINVAVNYAFRPPEIYVGTDPQRMKRVDEETVGELDWADIKNVDLSIRPRQYDINGKQGIKAYLAEMYVTIEKSNFAGKYNSTPDEEDLF